MLDTPSGVLAGIPQLMQLILSVLLSIVFGDSSVQGNSHAETVPETVVCEYIQTVDWVLVLSTSYDGRFCRRFWNSNFFRLCRFERAPARFQQVWPLLLCNDWRTGSR